MAIVPIPVDNTAYPVVPIISVNFVTNTRTILVPSVRAYWRANRLFVAYTMRYDHPIRDPMPVLTFWHRIVTTMKIVPNMRIVI